MENTMKESSIKPGLYVLESPISNPRPDRRNKRMWTCLPEFPAGTYCVETVYGAKKLVLGVKVTLVGSPTDSLLSYHESHEKQLAVLVAALKPKNDIELLDVFAVNGINSPRHYALEVLAYLVDYGEVKVERIGEVLKVIDDMSRMGGDTYEVFLARHRIG
jgi:hypothetical protein